VKQAFLFPGQGAQFVGMGKDFHDNFLAAREVFQIADELLAFSLSGLIFEGRADDLVLTKNSQVAIYVTSIATLAVIKEAFPDLVPSVCAGLSLGEYSALTAADRLDFVSGVRLVRLRGELMHKASEERKGTMAAVLGMDAEKVEKIVAPLDGVCAANFNCPGQVVISGTPEGVGKACEILRAEGAKRALPLDVSGAFHSELMESARKGLEGAIEATQIRESGVQVVMNVPGDLVDNVAAMKDNLKRQVTEPVRWQQGIEKIQGVDRMIEIGPGKTLNGMNRKIGVSVPTISVGTVADLEQLGASV